MKKWWSIWIKPSKTIQDIVNTNPNYGLFRLSFIYGLILISTFLVAFGFNLSFYVILTGILLAPFCGYALISVISWILYFTGKAFDGKAMFKHVRAAVAWSNVTMIVNVIALVVAVTLFKCGVSNTLGTPVSKYSFLTPLCLIFSIKLSVVNIWHQVIYYSTISQVQKYSIFKAICNTFVAVVILSIIGLIVFNGAFRMLVTDM